MGLMSLLTGRKKLTPESKRQILRLEKILQDSLRIIQSTNDLDTFFSRYALAEQTLEQIGKIAGENNPCIAGETPRACIHSLIEQKEVQTNNCIDRYIHKQTIHIMELSRGRLKKTQSVAAIIEEFAPQMTSQNLELAHRLVSQMTQKIKKLEAK